MRQRASIMVEIDGIEEITDRGIHVVLRGGKKRAWLPKDELDYLPGAVVVPEWLVRKMRRGDRKEEIGERT
ncbi:MAG: hypothetical protein ABIE47_12945 [Pseudomonadota bacterium]